MSFLLERLSLRLACAGGAVPACSEVNARSPHCCQFPPAALPPDIMRSARAEKRLRKRRRAAEVEE